MTVRSHMPAIALKIVLAAGLALTIAGALAATADAHRLYCGGTWCHHHTRAYYTLNETDAIRFQPTRNAQINWHNSVRLDLSSTSCHGCSQIHVIDNSYGLFTFIGAADSCYHCSHGHVRLNDQRLQSSADWQSTACEEIGHVIGLDHSPGVAGDCMNQQSVYVGSHSANEINSYYATTH